MAYLRCRAGFPGLRITARFSMVLPDLLPENADGRFPVLFLLADEGKNADEYVRHTDIEDLSREFSIAVVMPEGLHSDYENMQRGLEWYTYISKELPESVSRNFPISGHPEDRFFFGVGMGGLGAVKTGLREPGIAAVFGAFDTDFDVFSDDAAHRTPEYIHKLETIYGDDPFREEVRNRSDLYRMAEGAEDLSKIYLSYAEDGRNTASVLNFAAFVNDQGKGSIELVKTDCCGYLSAFLKYVRRENGSEHP